ncbi:MAG TPA: ATP-binding protein [Nocardioidaceae bacterium]|jgi:signal transduction histidine kinase
MDLAELRSNPLFTGLTESQLAELVACSEEVRFAEGEVLFLEARPAGDWFVLLEGSVTLSRRVGHEDSVVMVMSRVGQWSGGFRAWDEHAKYLATGTGHAPGRVLRLPADDLRRLTEAWFPLGVHLLQGLVGSVRKIETIAHQREALVALGTLAAGLAHELNNPAAAAARAVDALAGTHEGLLLSLRRLAEGAISAEQFIALDALRRELSPAAVCDPVTLSDLEEDLADWLAERRVEREWEVAPALAAAGATLGWCARVEQALGPVCVAPAVEWVAHSLTSAAILEEVSESTRRISELVSAVRTYSRLDRASVESVDLTEGLESTLVMLGHKLRPGVTVVREYAEDLPVIEAYAGELNQVWTNVIDNAVDAMAGGGTLTVAAYPAQDGAVVEIVDTGPGMPEAVAARAFEPFYTTKDVGQGTGLGLDISRRIIVERHGGDIGIESEPGRTVVRVRLPLKPPPEAS